MLVGFGQDLAGEANGTSNRIRGLLTQFHPSLERILGPRLDHQAVTSLLERYGSPQALRKAGRHRLVEVVRPRALRMAERLVDDIFTALDQQTVTVPGTGTGTLDVIVPSLAKSASRRSRNQPMIYAVVIGGRPARGPDSPSTPDPRPAASQCTALIDLSLPAGWRVCPAGGLCQWD